MKESVLSSGERGRLIGTLSRATEAKSALCAVVLNAGIVARVGPHRLHVRIARAIADAGIPCLRLDLSGLGDSGPAPGTLTGDAQAVADVGHALDALKRRLGVDRFVLIGLCSGADDSYRAALADARVTGVVMLDPWTYPTLRTRVLALTARFRRLGLLGVLRRIGARLARSGSAANDGRSRAQLGIRGAQSHAEFAAGLETLLERGVALHMLYTGALGDRYNYAAQFDEGFASAGLSGRVSVAYWPEVNHTFTEREMQARLAQQLVTWIKAIVAARFTSDDASQTR
jgi:pimeloyl-ACP methyl ester carboxylesterase